MSRVLFLLPPPEDSIRTVKNAQEGYGLGIPYLSAYLKQYGHETDALLDFHMSYEDYIKKLDEKLIEFDPDVISITMLSTNRVCCYRIIDHLEYHGVKIVVGGHHASCMADQLFERYPWIYVIKGEGDEMLCSIVDDDTCLPGIYEGRVVKDLDSLPLPDHDLYFKNDPDRRLACILTSRGCPEKCSFCGLPTISHRTHRRRSIYNVINEIVTLVTEYPKLEKIAIQDDSFMLNNKWVIDLCKDICFLDLHWIKFQVAGRVRPVSAELLYWMNKAGMHEIYIGVESGDQEILDRAHKKIRLGDVEHFFNFSKPYPKMIISPYLITGLPGETWDTVKETVRFIKSLQRIRYAFVLNSTPIWAFPGTELWESFKKAWHLENDDYWLGDGPCPNWDVEHNVRDLSRMRNYLLNRTSILRIFTPIGFVHQMTNAPYQVLKFLWYHPEYIKYALGGSFGAMFPRLYRKLRGDKIERRFE